VCVCVRSFECEFVCVVGRALPLSVCTFFFLLTAAVASAGGVVGKPFHLGGWSWSSYSLCICIYFGLNFRGWSLFVKLSHFP
jgi:hypothetical protein